MIIKLEGHIHRCKCTYTIRTIYKAIPSSQSIDAKNISIRVIFSHLWAHTSSHLWILNTVHDHLNCLPTDLLLDAYFFKTYKGFSPSPSYFRVPLAHLSLRDYRTPYAVLSLCLFPYSTSTSSRLSPYIVFSTFFASLDKVKDQVLNTYKKDESIIFR